MTQISERLLRMAQSATLAMSQKTTELRAAGVDVINLSVGEPDFPTPLHIKEAAKRAIDDNFSFYTPVPGYLSLRKAICQKLRTENGLDYAPEQIVIGGVEAARNGKPLKALSMMSGPSDYEVNLRCGHFDKDGEDFRTAKTGVPALLRVWAGEKPHGLDESALQLGFEFWKRDNKPLPPMSGLVARTTGFDEAERKRGIETANALSERVLAISADVEFADPSPALANALWTANWRLSRFARYREDSGMADRLDTSNGALTKMLNIMEYERLRTFMQMTPREGLQLALRRADFAEARRYSASVLRYDEDNPEANFAMGMSALLARRFEEAEMYLKRVLKRRPDEPAVLNNLSIICRKRRRWKESEEYARRAIAILPDSPEVKQTLSDALKKAP